jgi:hypothetical protein
MGFPADPCVLPGESAQSSYCQCWHGAANEGCFFREVTAEGVPSAVDPPHWSPYRPPSLSGSATIGVAAVALQPAQSSTTFPDLPLRATSNASA